MKSFVRTLFIAALVHSAHSAEVANLECSEPVAAGYVGTQSKKSESVVVFIHGLGGDHISTWKEGLVFTNYWPCMVRTDPSFSESNIYVYKYPTGILEGSTPVARTAAQLYQDMHATGVFDHRHVTIVAHSLGGLVTARMLLQLRGSREPGHVEALSTVRQVLFYGTPSSGSELASLVRLFGASKQIEDLADKGRAQETLAQWQKEDWRFAITCLAETEDQGIPPLNYRIVPEESAFAYCGKKGSQKLFLDGYNHIKMVKPRNADSEPYKRLATDYALCVRPLLSRGTQPVDAKILSRVRDWYSNFLLTLRKRSVDAISAISELLEAEQDNGPFVVPILGRTGLSSESYEFKRSPTEVAQEMVQQLPPRLAPANSRGEASILRVFRLSDASKVLRGRHTEDLKGRLELNAGVTEDAVAAIVGYDLGGAENVMLVFKSSGTRVNTYSMRGFLLPPQPENCVTGRL